ncbi:hypothetical protein Vadar_018138 [Vaccinium darrowii]|uniref:Uncharacterized protein n=1 Tax=Vaccinium darrowii TaxID=229202 RepID=A0ACB7ZCL5_9ERIC|nr:hypothetical protein Vadar_018138 [Vaccinium darrowii]
MQTTKEIDVEAFNWLAEKPLKQWSRSYYSILNKCDLLVNNLCEGFNKDIKMAREKPIIGMLEAIRCYLMKRMATRRKKISEWENNICPNIIDKVEKYKKKRGECNPTWCGEGYYQGRNMWPASGCVPILPPNYDRSIGSPRKSRRKGKGELENPDPEKLKRKNVSLRCGNCGQWGHNMSSCKNEANPAVRRRPSGGLVFSRPSVRPRGRPRGGGPQSSYGRGSDASQVTEVNQPFIGTNDIPTQASQVMGNNNVMGRGSDGATRGGRGRGGGNRGGRGRGDGSRGFTGLALFQIQNDSSLGLASQTNKSSDPATQQHHKPRRALAHIVAGGGDRLSRPKMGNDQP